MNRLITSTKMETVIKKFPKKVQDQMPSQTNSIKHLEVRDNINPSATTYKKLQRKENFKLILRGHFTLIPKPDKNTMKKEKISDQFHWLTYMQKSSTKY